MAGVGFTRRRPIRAALAATDDSKFKRPFRRLGAVAFRPVARRRFYLILFDPHACFIRRYVPWLLELRKSAIISQLFRSTAFVNVHSPVAQSSFKFELKPFVSSYFWGFTQLGRLTLERHSNVDFQNSLTFACS